MIYFLKGTIDQIKTNSIIIDVNDIGYECYVSHVDDYKEKTIIKLYIYNVIKEDGNFLIGFKHIDEKIVFLSLIKVKGMGPKMALNALKSAKPEEIINAIASSNISFLKRLPGVGNKLANQIILDLKSEVTTSSVDTKKYEDVYQALLELGFKKFRIDKVLSTINLNKLSNEEILRLALRRIR